MRIDSDQEITAPKRVYSDVINTGKFELEIRRRRRVRYSRLTVIVLALVIVLVGLWGVLGT